MKRFSALALATLFLSATAAFAAPATTEATKQKAYLVPYVGWFDATQGDNTAAQFGLEYRMKPYSYNVRPGIGANITTDGSLYGYGGIFWDIPLAAGKFYLTPNFVAGAYHKADGKRLGGPIEFRSGLEFSYVLPKYNSRVGVAFNHISNASIYDRNPGAETLLVNYHHPINW